MPFCFRANKKLPQEFRRIAREQVKRALKDLKLQPHGRHTAIHDARKRCKKLRGLIRLVRPAFADYSSANARFRHTARLLSASRDAGSLVECCNSLLKRFEDQPGAELIQELFIELRARRSRAVDDLAIDKQIETASAQLQLILPTIESWKLSSSRVKAIGDGLTKTYDRGLTEFQTAYERPTTANMHEWRKRVKYHRYHLQLLHRCWPGPMNALRREAKSLGEILGDEHDLAMLEEQLLSRSFSTVDDQTLDKLRDMTAQRRNELRHRAHLIGKRLFAQDAQTFRIWFKALWKAWQANRN